MDNEVPGSEVLLSQQYIVSKGYLYILRENVQCPVVSGFLVYKDCKAEIQGK